MKKMTNTTGTSRRAEFVYSTFLDDIRTNGKCGEWSSVNYRESRLSAVKNRDRSVEFRLKLVNSLLIEYHAHCYWVSVDDDWGYQYSYLKDEDPALSKAVLLRAWDYTQVILENLLKAGEYLHREYFILAASLMMEIVAQLHKYGVHINPTKQWRWMSNASENINESPL